MKTNINTALLFLLSAMLLYWLAGNFRTLTPRVQAEPITKTIRAARVVSDLRLSESETARVIHVPNPMIDAPEFDTSCVIYSDRDAKTSAMSCVKAMGSGGN